MKKKGLIGLLATAMLLAGLLVPVLVGTVLAGEGSMPSTKTAAVSDNISVTGEEWQQIGALDLAIKTGQPKDLIISVSLESTLFTTNKLSGKTGSQAEAAVEVEVRVNGDPVEVSAGDSTVVFNRRLVKLSGDLSHHFGGANLDIDDHWIEFWMETSSANSFNFIARDVRDSSDTNSSTIEVWVRAWGTASPSKDLADYGVVLGNASVVVDEVNLKDS